MHNISGDDEFFDAIGDEAEIAALKARAGYQPNPDDFTSRTTCDKNSDSSTRQFSQGIVRIRTFKPMNFDENENTLALTEIKDNKETTARNLQQILDTLDETTGNMSSEAPGSGTMKNKHRIESKETELESPVKTESSKSFKARIGYLEAPKVGTHTTLSVNTAEQISSFGPASARSGSFSKSAGKNPLHSGTASSGKKSFFSLLNKKRSSEAEFSRETVKQHNKNMSNFDKLTCLQSIDEASKAELTPSVKKNKSGSATWIVKFSPNNKLLATGGNDGVLRIYNVTIMDENINQDPHEGDLQLLDPNYISLVGHKSDIIDISWYKDSNLVLTSGIDKKVILWNVQLGSLVKIFEHSDIVPCISFHPLVDEFFVTGCFDKMIRIWDINETKVVDWIQTNDIITALTFSPDKTLLLVGFFKGIIKMYRIDQGKLKFTMEITCKNAFSWGKLNRVGKKVTAIVFTEDYEFLVMTNDSRMRLINLKTFETRVKYKGHLSGKYHIQPSYNFEKELILSGSEDEKVYVWNKLSDYVPQINPLYTTQKANRNTSYEYFKPFNKANTTCAVWMPFPVLQKYKEKMISVWKDIYVDSLIVLFSSDSKIKVLGNLIELEDIPDKK